LTPIYNYDDYAKIVEFQLNTALKRARKILEDEKSKRQINYTGNPANFSIGENVLLKFENRNKLDPFYKGPFQIIEMNGSNVTLEIDKKKYVTHKNNIIKI
jgi:uncharacterized protein YaaW (UPF0174 family)